MDKGYQQYPNPSNYQVVSFPQPLIPPDVDPDDPDLEMILVEYNPAWTEVLMAACDQLTQYSAWIGDDDQKKLAVSRGELLKLLLQQPVEIDEQIPAPYWDDESDVDDSLPPDEQEWYGYVESATAPPDELTFVESAVIWIFTGFIALVLAPTLPVGAAAAMTFRTLAVRFTLAFNRGDIREQFRVIVDATDYGNADTDGLSEGDIITMDVDGLEDLPYHDIMIVRTTP